MTVPDLRLLTEVTEIATGLGMTGLATVDAALAARPAVMQNVTEAHWARLEAARAAGTHDAAFDAAWANGRAFLESTDGLRSRLPAVVEWKGAHNPPGFEVIPADLRVDHVYLVSCKYQSKILHNSSPTNLFERRLSDRTAGAATDPWYQICSPMEYAHFYQCVRWHIGQALLPLSPAALTAGQLGRIRDVCGGHWPMALKGHWEEFSFAVASASVERWKAELPTKARQEEMLWRLIRLSPAPYFVLRNSQELWMRSLGRRPSGHQDWLVTSFSIGLKRAGRAGPG